MTKARHALLANPEGWGKAAGGNTPGIIRNNDRTPAGAPENLLHIPFFSLPAPLRGADIFLFTGGVTPGYFPSALRAGAA